MNEQELKQDFDIWYKDQKEMNPYIMRDWFISQFQQYKASLLSQIEEKIIEDIHRDPLNSSYYAGFNSALEDIKNKIK